MVRRYSEFHTLHRHLKESFPEIMSKPKFNFPGKRYLSPIRLGVSFLSNTSLSDKSGLHTQSFKDKDFLKSRKEALEAYLNAIVSEPELAKTWLFRQFLCEDKHFGFDIKRFRDFLPKKSSFVGIFTGISHRFKGEDKSSENTKEDELESEEYLENESNQLESSEMDQEIFNLAHHRGAESISNLLLELFSLNERSNWWRRQVILWVMQQFLGGTVERRIADIISDATVDSNLAAYLQSLNNLLESWREPPYPPARTQTQKTQSRLSVYKKVNLLIPEMAGSVLGRANAKVGSNRLFHMLQNRRLNQDLVYRAIDVILKKVMSS
jgi:hypothetical protein